MATTKKCIECGKRKIISNFVKGKDSDGYCFVCHDCRKKVSTQNELMEYCSISKRNFSGVLWDKSLEIADKKHKKKMSEMGKKEYEKFLTKKAINIYFSKMNINYSYDDDENDTPANNSKDEYAKDIDESLIVKWGSIKGFTKLDYTRLVDFEKDMMKDYRIETTAHRDYLKKICIISLQMDKSLAEGNINEFEKLSKQYDQLMKSAKFTAVQRSASDDTGGLNTFSEFFRIVEEEGFIPVFPKEDRDVVDSTITYMEDYLKKLFLNDPQIMSDIELSMQDTSSEEDDENIDDDYFEDNEGVDLKDE